MDVVETAQRYHYVQRWYLYCRVRRICNFFFIRFKANLSEYRYYSLHIRMFRYICKHLLFTSFASYSLENIRTNSHINIRFDAKIHVAANIRFRANFLILANICFKIFV